MRETRANSFVEFVKHNIIIDLSTGPYQKYRRRVQISNIDPKQFAILLYRYRPFHCEYIKNIKILKSIFFIKLDFLTNNIKRPVKNGYKLLVQKSLPAR